jgi:hypothetical protein
MKTHKILIDHVRFNAKPNGGAVGGIHKRLTRADLTIQSIAEATGKHGQSFTPGYMEGGRENENWMSQSLFGLDFDCGIEFGEVLERAEDLALGVTFAYETFRSTPEHPRLRVIWQLGDLVTQIAQRELITKLLFTVFPEADKQCTDAARLFYGGKGLLYENYNYFLDIDRLQEAAEESKGRLYSSGCELEDSEKNVHCLNNILSVVQKSESSLHPSNQRPQPPIIRHPDFEKLRKVRIFHDFLNRKKLGHQQLRGIASALRFMKGGQKLFKTVIESNPDYDRDKLTIMKYAKDDDWPIFYLKTFSPYESDWCYGNLYQAAKSSTIVRHQEFEGETLEDTRQSLQIVWNKILQKLNLNGFDGTIHVIKAVTGIGKTKLCESLDIPALIALPNHAIKEEIFSERMHGFVLNTPSINSLPKEIREKISPLYAIGATSEVNTILKKASETDPNVAEYRTNLFECYQSDSTVLTTHQKAIHIADWTHPLVIIDEDPLAALIPTSTVKYEDLLNLTKVVTEVKIRDQLQALLSQIQLNEKTVEKNKLLLTPEQQSFLYSTVLDNRQRFTSNILGFLGCDYWTVDPNDAATIHFISCYELPINKTTVILSATANEEIYKTLYGDRVRFHDLSDVEPTALIEQYTQHSMSRSSLDKPETLAWAREIVGNLPVITFSKLKHQFSNPVEQAHFGKCTGFDGLKGQDIAVVGTPHPSPITIALYGATLGILEAGSSVPKPRKQTVFHNGFSFPFTTYDNLELRALQFYFIETELRQAIGRARPYSKSCKVIVLSNYPLPEAFIVGVDVETESFLLKSVKCEKDSEVLQSCSDTIQGDFGIVPRESASHLSTFANSNLLILEPEPEHEVLYHDIPF